ncbi:NAD(P)H-binding protein [Companilactobacillus sp.]|jgi:putative NADH-flavin reductase|uniref:NAD(P)H-binding protein n=1 Tax=Companilactobacillus sp. TaxID=2767905 RepID=UPI0025BD4775|nr:NAD(P)H-binding protein [Companilactobacillus sp.]MCH4009158.1 NAD(P)H-binding protein [Companilactobacillus sp.]MCH4050663.1 NAD(P)H-binding protein [Companilactobacillus sp.]MCH4077100.1 NAD(P)H-binding protein [Companilactobacillus sp.]MCH4125676.1 NAD(P)H-binding protein [Companilactobacillus sp.]MCI1311385.1 NAD(P)H-binding protein [Companilactobacillus sp.]
MNILILGTGKLGYEVYKKVSVFSGTNITLFDRTPSEQDTSLAKQIIGDATNVDDLKAALKGIDVVYSTLGPFDVDQFAKPLVKAMEETGVKRLFWTTQFQLNYPEITPENFALAKTFGFSEEIETNYVTGQKAGADTIKNSNLDYTLLLCHFFKYNDDVEKSIVEPVREKVSGEPISLYSLSLSIAEMLYNQDNYPEKEYMISAEK